MIKQSVILFFYLFTFLPLTALAAPAWPFPFQVKQPDGTMLTIQLHGDEHFNWISTATDDVLLVSKGNAYYVAEVNDDGTLTATALLAHDALQRTADELTAIERQTPRRVQFVRQGDKHITLARRAPQVTNTKYFPHTGTPRVLVILAAYADFSFTLEDPIASFDQCLNGTSPMQNLGHGENRVNCSVAEYFTTVSRKDYIPQFDIVGPVTLPEDMAVYGNDNNLTKLCKDACQQLIANQPDFDFTPYDNDGDGSVDMVYIVHAGYGENMGGPKETMWARCGTINVEITSNVKVAISGCHSELAFNEATTEKSFGGIPQINGTGVLIHEFSHGMGLPDIYSTTSAAQQTSNQSMQRLDVMDVGCYGGNSWEPAAYTAWEQEAMGWLTIVPLDEARTGISLTPIIEGGTAYKIQNPDKENEYIVLENIQKRGINKSSYGHGLLAYHIDYPYSTVNMNDAPNNIIGHPRVAAIPSGGLLISSYQANSEGPYTQEEFKASNAATPFPGTKDVTTLTDDQELTNFCFYSGEDANNPEVNPVGHALYNIQEAADGIVTFDYDDNSATGISPVLNLPHSTLDHYYTLDGHRLNGVPTQPGVYINNGRKVIIK